jgi:hypothetical protein
MPNVAIDASLYERVERVAQWTHQPTGKLTQQALETFLDQVEWDKLNTELEAFDRLLPSLLATHSGQYVAIHEGGVIGFGPNLPDLHVQIFKLLGNTPVLFKLVTTDPEADIQIRSPRLD